MSIEEYFDTATGHYVQVDTNSNHWVDLTSGEEGFYSNGGSYYNYTNREDGLYGNNSSYNSSTGNNTIHNWQRTNFVDTRKYNKGSSYNNSQSSYITIGGSLWSDLIKPWWNHLTRKSKKRVLRLLFLYPFLIGIIGSLVALFYEIA